MLAGKEVIRSEPNCEIATVIAPLTSMAIKNMRDVANGRWVGSFAITNQFLDQKGSPYLNACRKEVVQFDPPIARIANGYRVGNCGWQLGVRSGCGERKGSWSWSRNKINRLKKAHLIWMQLRFANRDDCSCDVSRKSQWNKNSVRTIQSKSVRAERTIPTALVKGQRAANTKKETR